MMRLLRLPFIWFIKFYRYFISPMVGPQCKFTPTCSEYALQAFSRFGVFKGLWLTIIRLAKCNPWHVGGEDHVPCRRHSCDDQGS